LYINQFFIPLMDYIILRSGKDINPNFAVDWPPEDTLSKDELINTLKKWWHTTNKSDEKLKCIINAIFIDGYKIYIDWSDTYNIIQAHHMKTHQIIDLIFLDSISNEKCNNINEKNVQNLRNLRLFLEY